MSESEPRITVVIGTRNRRVRLLETLERHLSLPERPCVIVVDNASTDGTPDAVRARFPEVRVVPLARERGASARNIGVELATTEYVALTDDDAWWEPGALGEAVAVLDRHPRLALLAPQILVGERRRPDPANLSMSAAALPSPAGLPGPAVLGFVACAAVLRRDAFLEVGGFEPLLYFIGDEMLLAIDLATAGWQRSYVPRVIAIHDPSPVGGLRDQDREWRTALELRNVVLIAVMRRPAATALRWISWLVRASLVSRPARVALYEFLVRLPEALKRRRVVPARVDAEVRRVYDGMLAGDGRVPSPAS